MPFLRICDTHHPKIGSAVRRKFTENTFLAWPPMRRISLPEVFSGEP
jgi:hypothetical protein